MSTSEGFIFEDFLTVFADIVEKYPDNCAVLEEGTRSFTYRQLADDAKSLASRLRSLGLDKELAAVIAIPKSYRYLVALLAIWKAGGAFVPVDAALPAERLRSIFCEISEHNKGVTNEPSPLLILCEQEHRMHLEASSQESAFVLQFVDACIQVKDNKEHALSNPKAATTLEAAITDKTRIEPGKPRIKPGDLAYIIFTSGSTGRPKGVMVEHRGIVNLLREQIAAFEISSTTRSLFYLSTSFDAAVSDLGTALLAGATLLIERPENLRPDAGLMQLMRDRQVSYVDIPPSVLSLLNIDEKPDCLKSMVIGGEVCPKEVVRRWAEKLHLVCVYGPTEATICTSLSHCASNWDAPLIGMPIANVQYRIMDEHVQRELPPGQAGELCISGVQLCRGYLHREIFNQERFFVHDGERYYRTRDRVKSLPSGNFEFVGRVDRQMKLRGLLIEPEEVEAALTSHPDIARACVLKGKLPRGRDILLAYLTSKTGKTPGSPLLRKYLASYLPAWMLPQRFIYLDAIPETTSGKPDMKALADMYAATKSRTSGKVSATNIEATIAQALCNILGYQEIGASENFFDLGLDSLGTIELTAALNNAALDMAPEALFKYPSVQRLAEFLKPDKENIVSDGSSDKLKDYSNVETLLSELKANNQFQSLLNSPLLNSDKCSKLSQPETILFTGATGFLGSRLLAELLNFEDSYKSIYAIVRAASNEEAEERILATAKKYLPANAQAKLHVAIKANRIIPLPGDISKPKIGLNAEVYERLAKEVDQVVHLAATVNMVLPFEQLKAANLDGTLNIAAFALQAKLKSLHYASTLSVFVSTDKNSGVLKESDRLEDMQAVHGGYAQSKWLAEKALLELQDSGSPLSIYRFGLITGDTTGGITADTDFLNMFVRGLKEIGAIPAECLGEQANAISVDITPVDYAAATMAQILSGDNADNDHKVYHIANHQGLSLRRLAETTKRLCADLKTASLDELNSTGQWQQSISAAAAYLGLCRLFDKDSSISAEQPKGQNKSSYAKLRVMDLFQATGVVFAQENTAARLAASGIRCPEISDKLVDMYVKVGLSKY